MPAYGCFDIPDSFSLYNQGDQVSKDADYRSCDKYEYKYTGNPFFQVGIFTEKVPRIKQKTYKEYNPEDDWKNGPDGIRNVIDGIFDTSDLGEKGSGKQGEYNGKVI